MKHKLFIFVVSGILAGATIVGVRSHHAEAASNGMIFPIIGYARYSNDYTAPRANGPHHATDIFAAKGTPVVSATDGTIIYAPYPQPSWGYMVKIRSNTGWTYSYIHLNNDTPGTDDGKGGPMRAYAPGIRAGEKVRKGQLLGWVGDSGNAENTPPHLHFERYKPDDTPTNPYYALRTMLKITKPAPAQRQLGEIVPNTERKDGLNISLGNLVGDESIETVVGIGRQPRVSVYNNLDRRIYTFLAYSANYTGGVDVATGDVDGDGYDEIITTTGGSGMPRVRVFEPNGTMLTEFNAYASTMRSGMTVASGDVDGDGTDDIVVGPRQGGGSTVKAFRLNGTLITSFLTGSVNYSGGVDVATIDADGDGSHEIVTGYLRTTGPRVKIFDQDGTTLRTITPFSTKYVGGLRVATGTHNGQDIIVTLPSTNYVPLVKMYNVSGIRLGSEYYIEQWWRGYYDIAASDSNSIIRASTGINRRDSVRTVNFW